MSQRNLKLKSRIILSGMLCQELAIRCNRSPAWVSNLIAGDRRPKDEDRKRIAKELETTEDELGL